MKNLSCFQNFRQRNRFVYAGPEGGPEVQKQTEEKTEKSPFEDRSKREDVYRRAEAKAQELKASDDPKKQERGEQMLQDVAAARATEKKMDVSMAITEAHYLDDRLSSIVRREAIAARKEAAAAAKKEQPAGGTKVTAAKKETTEKSREVTLPPDVMQMAKEKLDKEDTRQNKDKNSIKMRVSVGDEQYVVVKIGGGERRPPEYHAYPA